MSERTNRIKRIGKRTLRIARSKTRIALKAGRRQFRRGPILLDRDGLYYIPLWLAIVLALAMLSLPLWDDIAGIAKRGLESALRGGHTELAPFFAQPVRHWSANLDEWARRHDVDRDLLATVMQIESCGHPQAISPAGARGLFQVMPFHFADDEDMFHPDTNAMRASNFLNYCHDQADAVIGLTLACYNGGPSVLSRPRDRWPRETQAYYRWGLGIFSDAIAGKSSSDTMNQWLQAGGTRLCEQARLELSS